MGAEFDFKLAVYIFSFTIAIGGVVGGILTHINKIRFVRKAEFDDHRTNCPVIIGGKIDSVSKAVEDLKDTVENNALEGRQRREKDNEFLHENLRNIAQFVGSVEQYMKEKKL